MLREYTRAVSATPNSTDLKVNLIQDVVGRRSTMKSKALFGTSRMQTVAAPKFSALNATVTSGMFLRGSDLPQKTRGIV